MQGMQQMLEETELESREMRRKYVALGDRVADAMRSRSAAAAGTIHSQERPRQPFEVQVSPPPVIIM